MALTPTERQEVYRRFVNSEGQTFQEISILKSELKVAGDAIDDWIDSVQSSFNQAIPEPARSGLTQNQKIKIFMYILNLRVEVQ